MKKLLKIGAAMGVIGASGFWWLTAPPPLPDVYRDVAAGDADAGEQVFHAAGCVSCHSAPDTKGRAMLTLAGGKPFPSDFGTFYAPNISSDPQAGIGGWSYDAFARAVTQGVSPQGQHYYPAFPYAAYQNMQPGDLANLYAYMQTLPASDTPSSPHDVGFPFSIRRGLGLWKLVFNPPGWTVPGDLSPAETRGRYLVEALSHCGECHTARNAVGGLQRSQWLAGAPHPSGKGKIPNITPAALDWSDIDLIAYFKTGLTPDYDSAGGEMVEVIDNLSKLPDADLEAIVAYLRRVPPVATAE
ncbi:MAG: cytochrome c [Sulfitobacter sp.]